MADQLEYGAYPLHKFVFLFFLYFFKQHTSAVHETVLTGFRKQSIAHLGQIS